MKPLFVANPYARDLTFLDGQYGAGPSLCPQIEDRQDGRLPSLPPHGGGADIRVIQEMLGHAKISTTELYTRVSINLLKQVYLATYPAANLKEKAAESDV